MPKQTIEYQCLLISPGDVAEERRALTELVTNWNAHIGRALGARVELVRWESHATPDMSNSPQNIINAQLLEDCDLGIAVFWSRLGTPTDEYASGSVEEINRLTQRGARVMVYFNSQPIPQEALGNDQFAKLQGMRTKFQQEGLLATYSGIADLREKVNLHLTSVITHLLAKDRNVPMSEMLTAPMPDIRVTTSYSFTETSPGSKLIPALTIQVQNHSPVVVYLQAIYLESRSGGVLLPNGDFISNDYQKMRELHPGRSFSLRLDPLQIQNHLSRGFTCAAVKDDIGRVYRSSEAELSTALKMLFDNLHQFE